MAFLASHRAAGHISGQCLSVDGGMEGRIIWREPEGESKSVMVTLPLSLNVLGSGSANTQSNSSRTKMRPIKVALSVDFDAISGWLGTGAHPDNNMADFSAGIFSGAVGVPRLLKLFKKLGLADKVTWFIPGHSLETFPLETKMVVDSGCEIALHGYSHEGAMQMSEEQERDVFLKCIELATKLTGKKPRGWRAPLYQIRESTFALLEELDFHYGESKSEAHICKQTIDLYLPDSSLSNHDSEPFFAPKNPPMVLPNFSEPAASWMHPSIVKQQSSSLVEIPCNWYMEDATPMSYYPHTPNSHGYVDTRRMEQMWKDRFTWLWENERELTKDSKTDFLVFPLVLHPDTSGMAHIIGMIERFLNWVKGAGQEVRFETYESIAMAFKEHQKQG